MLWKLRFVKLDIISFRLFMLILIVPSAAGIPFGNHFKNNSNIPGDVLILMVNFHLCVK